MADPDFGDTVVMLAALLKAFGGPTRVGDVRRASLRFGVEPEVLGRAVRFLRTRGLLVESEDATTWAPGGPIREFGTSRYERRALAAVREVRGG